VAHRRIRTPLGAHRFASAIRLVELAWEDLPQRDRILLQSVGAAQHDVIDRPLGSRVAELLASAGAGPLAASARERLDRAIGVWVPELRVVVIDAGNPALVGLDDSSYEVMIVRAAWHEWGHALSIARATADDVFDGERLLGLAPNGIGEAIRSAGYLRGEYTHELVAETYALLMARRRRGVFGKPSWLHDEIWALMRRVCGWTH
jgi:hypothetical protein